MGALGCSRVRAKPPTAFLALLKSSHGPVCSQVGPAISTRHMGDHMPVTSNVTELPAIDATDLQCQALQIFDGLPAGLIAFAVPDHGCEPLLKRGEVAVIDVAARQLSEGALYLRRIISCDGQARLSVVEFFTKPWGTGGDQQCAMFFARRNRPKAPHQWPGWAAINGPVPIADGPFFAANHDHMAHQMGTVVGRVIGILSPAPSATSRRHA